MIKPTITRLSNNVIIASNSTKTIQKIIKFDHKKDLIYLEYQNYLKLISDDVKCVELFDTFKQCENLDFLKYNILKVVINSDITFILNLKDLGCTDEKNNIYFIMSNYIPSKISLYDFITNNDKYDIISQYIINTLSKIDYLYKKYGFIHCDFHTKNILIDSLETSIIDLEMSKFIEDNKTIKYEDLDVGYLQINDEYILTKRFMHFFDIFILTIHVYSDVPYDKKIQFLLYLNNNISNNPLFLYFYVIFINYHIYITNNVIIKSISLTHKSLKTLFNVFNCKNKTLINLYNNSIFNHIVNEIYDILFELKNENSKYYIYENTYSNNETWKQLLQKYSTKKLIIKCLCCGIKGCFIHNSKEWNLHIQTNEHSNLNKNII